MIWVRHVGIVTATAAVVLFVICKALGRFLRTSQRARTHGGDWW